VNYIASRPQDMCQGPEYKDIPRNTTITVECAEGSDGSIVSVVESSKCKYNIVMKHKAACGKL